MKYLCNGTVLMVVTPGIKDTSKAGTAPVVVNPQHTMMMIVSR